MWPPCQMIFLKLSASNDHKCNKKINIYFQFCVFGIQGQTMQAMYDTIARELKAMQLSDVNPQDYLNFYCLGNREDLNEENLSTNGAQVIF